MATIQAHSQSSLRKLSLHDSRERGHWASHTEFILSCIGMSVGLGNFWRFPTLAYDNGGAAFFIPYIILQVIIGTPVYFMELALGQYCGCGAMGVFRLNPFAKGVGVSMVLNATMVALYYSSILALCLYYMFASMQATLPWTKCKPEWIYHHCFDYDGATGETMPVCDLNFTKSAKVPDCKCTGNKTIDFNIAKYPTYANFTYEKLHDTAKANMSSELMMCSNRIYPPSHFYFYDTVTKTTGSDLKIGFPIWHLSLCLLLSSIICVCSQLRGIRSSGKVVYFTVFFPYVVILILLVKTATLEGSIDGLILFLSPKWSQLANIKVWLDAGGQMFFSLSVSNGMLLTYGSYNRIHYDIYRDALIICAVDMLTSFLGGLVVFMTLGSMAHNTGQNVEDVAAKGLGLAFVVYPEALSSLPAPQVWSFLFFFMLYTLGIDSLFAMTETILTTLLDEVPRFLRDKMVVTILTGIIMYMVSMIFVTPGGSYLVDVLDVYGATYPLYIVCFCEVASVGWTYGYARFLGDIRYMIGYSPHPQWFWAVCWTVIIPITTIGIVFVGLIQHKPLSYTNWGAPGEITRQPFGPAAQLACWFTFICALLPIPVVAIWAVVRAPGDSIFEKIAYVTTPLSSWGPLKNRDQPSFKK